MSETTNDIVSPSRRSSARRVAGDNSPVVPSSATRYGCPRAPAGARWSPPPHPDRQRLPPRYSAAVGCDLHVGRKTYTLLHDLGMTDIAVDYVVLDTLRVPRDTFARIWEAWRDGYTDTMTEHTGISREEIETRWREMIACVRDERGYALWQVPVWTAEKPAR
jgi:hypothetical protein